MTATSLDFVLLTVCGWINRRQLLAIEYLREESRVLREQLGDTRLLLSDAQRRRLAEKGKALGRKALAALACIATPETIRRWYRRLIANKCDGSTTQSVGRQRKSENIRELILRMAKENSGWGYTRIVGALKNLGHDVSRMTVARVLAEHGIDPAPKRSKSMSWSEFLRTHWDGIAAADFFTVEALTLTGLTRFHVLFVIELKTRAIHIAGIVHEPGGEWIMQVGRNLLDAVDGFLRNKKYPIIDRDRIFTAQFRRLLRESGVTPLPLPVRSPNLNAYAERFVGSIRRECLDKLVLLGESHLRRVVTEYAAHYHNERNHQALGNRLIKARAAPENDNVGTHTYCHRRLGGLLKYYRNLRSDEIWDSTRETSREARVIQIHALFSRFCDCGAALLLLRRSLSPSISLIFERWHSHLLSSPVGRAAQIYCNLRRDTICDRMRVASPQETQSPARRIASPPCPTG